jgi:hypothetical protein
MAPQVFGGNRPNAARKAKYEVEQATAALADDHAMSNTYDKKKKRLDKAKAAYAPYRNG